MTVICEHFVHTSLPRRGFVTLASPGLTPALVKALTPPFEPSKIDVGISVTLPEESKGGRVAVSYLRRHEDEYRRPFIHNHTFLAPRDGYVELGAHPRAFDRWYLDLDRFGVEQPVEPIAIEPDANASSKPSRDDLRRVGDSFPREGLLADVVSAIESGQQRRVTVTGTPRQAIDLVYSLLRVLPLSLRSFPFATFEPPGGHRLKYLLTVLHAGGDGKAVHVATSSSARRPAKITVDLERAVLQADESRVASAWAAFDHRHRIFQALSLARKQLLSGELEPAASTLSRAAKPLQGPDAQQDEIKEYQTLYLELTKKTNKLDAYWTALNHPSVLGNKPATAGKVLEESGVAPEFKTGLAFKSLLAYDPPDLQKHGIVAFILRDPDSLISEVAGGRLSLASALKVLLSDSAQWMPLLLTLFQFDVSAKTIESHEGSDTPPRFIDYLNDLAALEGLGHPGPATVKRMLEIFTGRLQAAFDNELKKLDHARRGGLSDLRPRYAAQTLALLRRSGATEKVARLAVAVNSKVSRRRWSKMLDRFSGYDNQSSRP